MAPLMSRKPCLVIFCGGDLLDKSSPTLATPWTAAHRASLSITNSQILLKLMSISQWCHPSISSSVVPFSFLQSFPATGSFQMSQFFTSGGQSIGASASASVLPMNIQYWFPLGLTGLISLQSKGLSRVFSSTTIPKHRFLSASLLYVQLSHLHMTTGKAIALTIWTFKHFTCLFVCHQEYVKAVYCLLAYLTYM